MIFFDTETCGLHGFVVTIQYAVDDDVPTTHHVWHRPVQETIDLIKKFTESTICGFNLSFDWFHLQKCYNVFDNIKDKSKRPEVREVASLERASRTGKCIKPVAACDVMLCARRGPFQSLMARDDIRIRKVPVQIADKLAVELEQRIQLDKIYFAKRKDQDAPKWKVEDSKFGENLKNVTLRFAPKSGLKNLWMHIFGKEDVDNFADVGVNRAYNPVEFSFMPFAFGNPSDWKDSWPKFVDVHINHWFLNERAKQYGINDVIYTRDLYNYFCKPSPGDVDSELSCMVASVRWKGYSLDLDGLKKLQEEAVKTSRSAPKKPAAVRAFLNEVLSKDERTVIQDSTAKGILEEISKWDGHPAQERARNVLKARQAQTMSNVYAKLIQCERFHVSMTVIGTKSTRMSGRTETKGAGKSKGGLNPQGISKNKNVRSKFVLHDPGHLLCGGDFDAFEVSLAEALYNDPKLREELVSGKSIHGLFGTALFPGKSYEDIMASKGTDNDLYNKSKVSVFALIYGGDENTLKAKAGVELEVAKKAVLDFTRRYEGAGIARKKTFDKFCSMRQPKGIGTKVIWHEPVNFIESMFGFKRFFDLENKICKALYDLSNRPPPEWREFKQKVTRHDREQTSFGAVQSALYGAAFQLQAANMRAAANHEIQSSGAQITKFVQERIWSVQPSGIHDWIVQPMNVHDELMCPVKIGYEEIVRDKVNAAVESFRAKVPLISMKWKIGLKNWAGK